MVEVGEIIRQARKEKGMSQSELAKSAGTTKQNIANYENGRRKPRTDVLIKIAGALGINIAYLLSGYMSFDTPEEYEEYKKRIQNSPGVEVELIDTYDIFKLDNLNIRRINEMLNTFNDAGIVEAEHQIELLSKIEEYKE